jgi:negative regulator of sigma E activity
MSTENETLTNFERNARTVLEAGVARIDARTRSRLTQARHAALAAAQQRRPWWRSLTLMPAAGAVAAALLVSVVLWHREPGAGPAADETRAAAVEDMDLLADSDALDLIEGWDGPFYEWAAAQSETGESEG